MFASLQTDALFTDVRSLFAQSDKVVVLYHGGKEHCRYPSPRVYKLCRAMIDNGADLVLCQHSHCIATYETYHGGHILHGQGNFHFQMQQQPDCWRTSLAVRYDTVTNQVEFLPIASDGLQGRAVHQLYQYHQPVYAHSGSAGH